MKSPKDIDFNLGITVSRQIVRDYFDDWMQAICEEFNMGDLTEMDLVLKLRTMEKYRDRLLKEMEEAKR
jgi:hypothetical protein